MWKEWLISRVKYLLSLIRDILEGFYGVYDEPD
jgi:hypothetical protein